ncbi:MAG: type II secretion system protein [Candidatus Kerfeldbacteria bacterium]|nr:type II secretion system protein [Candidatus Kerfeldbacteria bacterium]
MTRHIQRGFTLVEVILTISVFTVIGLVATTVFISQSGIARTIQSIVDQQNGHARLLREFIVDLRSASAIDASSSATSLTVRTPSYDATRAMLPATDLVTYALDGDTVVRTVAPDPSSAQTASRRALATGITHFHVEYDETDVTSATAVVLVVQFGTPDELPTVVRIFGTL